ncbi:hypothetical protein BaRGS_00007262, partial [Batillaria attramentaria]
VAQALEAELNSEVAMFRGCMFAMNTAKTYRTHLATFLDFCNKLCIPPVPVSESTVARYAAFLARKLKPASVRQYLNVVRILHLESGLDNPCKDSRLVKSTLKGIEREKGCEIVRKTPITPPLLMEIRSKLSLQTRNDCVLGAACLLMFFGLLRKSNLFANGAEFCGEKQLTRDCFQAGRASQFLSVVVCWSKNNQCRKRRQVINLPVLHPHPLCPVSAIVNMFKLTGPQAPKSPAFPLSSYTFCQRLRAVLSDRPNVTSHSFRRGGGGCYVGPLKWGPWRSCEESGRLEEFCLPGVS